ncbi:hypothetical protein H312_02367, partial [Anncaliia algerae PRA339]
MIFFDGFCRSIRHFNQKTFFLKENYLVANDVNKERMYSLKSNYNRLGINNVIITNYDARTIELKKFNKILLDAPCSGTGVIHKD